jgi:hypothetical protein
LGLIVSAIRGGGPEAFDLLSVAIFLWNGYWWLLRIGFQVEVVGGVLEWRAPLKKRRVPIDELSGNGSMWMGFEKLKVRDQRSLIVLTGDRGWITFLESLNRATGSETFQVSALNRLMVKMQWSRSSDGYYED